MTAAARQALREAIDAHKRAEIGVIVALGKGRCSGCLGRHEDYNDDCQRCRDRKRRRG